MLPYGPVGHRGPPVLFAWVDAGRSYRLERVGRRVEMVTDLRDWRVSVRLVLRDGHPVPAALDVRPAGDTLPAAGLARVVDRVRFAAYADGLAALLSRPGARPHAVRLRVPSGPTPR